MEIEEFRKLCQRDVNRTIAMYQGFICDDRWEYNQNAMREGKGSMHYGNLSLVKRGTDKFHVIGWNPFNSNGDAFKLMVHFNMQGIDFDDLDMREAREQVVFRAYKIADEYFMRINTPVIQTREIEENFDKFL